MTVWVEDPRDDESAVWGCTACEEGGWCEDRHGALMEAREHGKRHAESVPIPRGPRPDFERDRRIQQLRADGATIRRIASVVALSPAGVMKALGRKDRAA